MSELRISITALIGNHDRYRASCNYIGLLYESHCEVTHDGDDKQYSDGTG